MQRIALAAAAVAVVLGLALALGVTAAPAGDEILSLPGWSGPLPSRMYSGLITSGTAPNGLGLMHQHYWFVESENDPANDPVVVWYNGGPGASSLFGLLVELGPVLLNENSITSAAFNATGVPQLQANPYSWSKVANVLAVDNPPPVGFSYCDPAGPTGDGYSCGNWNDALVGTTNHAFLKAWIKEFPEFAQNDMFITGESYAGVYVPVIVREILKDPNSGLNLKGFAVGDGCIGNEVLCGSSGPYTGPFWDLEFLHGHGQVPEYAYNAINEQCPVADQKLGNLTNTCSGLINAALSTNALGGFYGYNLYDDCVYEDDFLFQQTAANSGFIAAKAQRSWWSGAPRGAEPMRARSGSSKTSKTSKAASKLGGAVNDYPCPGAAMSMWINRTDVRAALNVPLNKAFFNGDNGVGFNYSLTEPNLLPFYAQIITTRPDLRVLVYNGDTDPGINSMITQEIYFDYFQSQSIDMTQEWRPWTTDGKQRMGGYVASFGSNWSYLTIRGSGHMVPEYKPAMALEFLTRFLSDTPYQPYVPPSATKAAGRGNHRVRHTQRHRHHHEASALHRVHRVALHLH